MSAFASRLARPSCGVPRSCWLNFVVWLAACCFSVHAAEPLLQTDALTLTPGGRIKFDALVSSRGLERAGSSDYSLAPGSVPLDDTDSVATVSLRGSRLWLKANAPGLTSDAYFEVDFYGRTRGNENLGDGYDVRLRHGYGVWRSWLGGQTWSTFMNLSAFPEINDGGIPAGMVFARQPMVRWTHATVDSEFALAAELADTTVVDTGGRRLRADAPEFPDLVARYSRFSARANWSAALMVRDLRIDRGRGPRDDSATGVAASVSGRLAVGSEDELRFGVAAGNALGRYLSGNGFDDARLDDAGRLARNLSAGGYFAWQHWWNADWRSNLVVGLAWQADRGLDPENQLLATLHANCMRNLGSDTTVGIELISAHRQRFDDDDGELLRLQFTLEQRF